MEITIFLVLENYYYAFIDLEYSVLVCLNLFFVAIMQWRYCLLWEISIYCFVLCWFAMPPPWRYCYLFWSIYL